MEGCPRSSMLSIDLKDSLPVEFTDSLKKYVTDHYQEDPENYQHECTQLEQLRVTCLHPSHDHSGCSALRRYFAQLQFLQSRFPMVDGGSVAVQFTWTDLYSEESIALADVRFEQAAILHNLGALHSQLGCQEDRTGEEGMKVACTHFQAAAGVFQHLKDIVMVPLASMKLPWVSEDHFAVPFFDLASCVLQLYINILLGQAQECLLEKSILDGRKDSLIARISMQVCDYYQQALGILESLGSSYLGSKKSKLWTKTIKIKACHFTCVSYIHMSNHAHENQKFGEKVSYLKAANQKLTEAQKQSKGQPERTLELLQFMADVVSNKLEGAVKDNDFIYHEVVPDLASLPVIKGATLVKPIPFQPCDPSVSGPDIFQRLIPIEAHSDASIYSEEKAKLLRRYNSSIDAKNKQLRQSLASLHIDDLLQPEETDSCSKVLKKLHIDPQSKDGVLLSQAAENIKESTILGENIETTLKNISSLLDEDVKKEQLAKVTQEDAAQERSDIRKEHDKCQEALKKANHTHNELARVYNAHRQNLDLLAGPEEQLLAALPSLNIIDSPVDDGAVQRLRDLIAKVEEMKAQRISLEESLRKQLNEDDITGLLVTRDGNKMAFFDEQLKKHDTSCSLIQANLDAQSKILSALTEANAKYAKTRQAVKANSQRREEVVGALSLSFATFFELQGKLSQGVDFYKQLLSTVKKIEERCKNFFDNHSKKLDKLTEKEKVAPPKPPGRPSAAKPDHLVRPQQPNPPLPGTLLPGQNDWQPGNMYHHMTPMGPLPTTNIPPGALPQHPRPGQSIPSSIPGHPVTPTLPSSLPHSVPHIPADQGIRTMPRMSYPGLDNRGQVSEPGQFPRQNLPGPASPSQAIPRFPFQNQVLPNQQPPGSSTSQVRSGQVRPGQVSPAQQPDILGGQQQVPGQQAVRPQIPPQQLPGGPPQPDLISQVRPPFSNQNSIPFPHGHRLPFQRPGSPQSPMGQQPARYQTPSSLSFPVQPLPVSSAAQPRQQFQPRPSIPSSLHQQIFPGQQQQQLRPSLQPQFRPFQPGQPPHFQPRQQFNQSFHPGQPLRPEPMHQPFRQERQPQPHFRPDSPSQQPLRPVQPNQPPRPQQPPQMQFRPEQPQLQIRPNHPSQQQPYQPQQSPQQAFPPFQQPQQPFRPPQSPQPPFRPQQPSNQPLRPQQPNQQQVRPEQLSQQQTFRPLEQQPMPPYQQPPPTSFQQQMHPSRLDQNLPKPLRPEQFNNQQKKPEEKSQLFRPDKSSQQPFRPDQSSQQPFRPDQSSLKPFRPEQSSQKSFRPDQSSQQPFRPDQSSQQPFRPDQTSQQPFRSDQSSQQPFRPDQTSQQPFRPEQTPKQPFRPEQTPQQPFRPEQTPQQPFRPDQTSQQPFRPDQSTQQPFQSNQSSGKPLRPEQSFQQPFRADQLPQQSFRPEQSSQQPFQSNQSSGKPLRPEQSSQQPFRADQLPQQSFRPEQSSQQPFGPNQSSLPPAQQPFGPEQTSQRPFQVKTPDRQPIGPSRQENQGPFHSGQNNAQTLTNVSQSYSQQNLTPNAQSYPETGALLANQSSLPYSYGGRPTPSLLSQGSRPFPNNVTSSDYLTSYSVALAQSQLNQYQNSSEQHQQMQQFQQQLLLQQQQLILQQQDMLRQQQTQQHPHDGDQIGLLLQQILQQQKQLSDLEMKLKDKGEHVEQKIQVAPESTTKSTVDEEKKVDQHKEQTTDKKADKPQGTLSGSEQSEKVEVSKVDSEPPLPVTFVPNYEAAGQWFTDLSIAHDKGQSDSTALDKEISKDSDHSLKTGEHVGDLVEKKETNITETPADENTSEVEASDTKPEYSVVSNQEDGPIFDDIDSGNDEIDILDEDEESCEDTEEDEARRRDIEEQIKQIKELENMTTISTASNFYEPGQLPSSVPNKPGQNVQKEDNKPSLDRQCGHYYASQISSIDQDTNNSCLNCDEALQALVSAVKGYDLVVKSLSADKNGSSSDGFCIEWRELDRLQEYDSASLTTHAATMNQPKNRYRDILPWDHTRVKLMSKDDSDYVNANFIKNITPLSPTFIATQGPLATTLTDFWLMVWEQQSHLIVMLTREVEGDKLMCHQYWPIDEGHTILFGPIRVTLKALVTSPLSVKRVMHVQHTDCQNTLVVTHLQFCGWPDKGVPQSPAALLGFVNDTRSCYQQSLKEYEDRPIVLHCSAGIGRTGTFITIYSAMQEFNANREFVNIPRLVRNLRLHRKYMVQRREQYEFCYKTILFYARQFLDLELASISHQKRASLDLAQLENVSIASPSKDSPRDKPTDSKTKSEVRFLGELRSDDSLEREDNNAEQSISEKYCKGTLETDNEKRKVKKGGKDSSEGTVHHPTRKDSLTRHEERTGKVSIGQHKEVRFTKEDDDEDMENEDQRIIEHEQEQQTDGSSIENIDKKDDSSESQSAPDSLQKTSDGKTNSEIKDTSEEQDNCKTEGISDEERICKTKTTCDEQREKKEIIDTKNESNEQNDQKNTGDISDIDNTTTAEDKSIGEEDLPKTTIKNNNTQDKPTEKEDLPKTTIKNNTTTAEDNSIEEENIPKTTIENNTDTTEDKSIEEENLRLKTSENDIMKDDTENIESVNDSTGTKESTQTENEEK